MGGLDQEAFLERRSYRLRMAERRTRVLGPNIEVVRSVLLDEESRTILNLVENAVRLNVDPRPRARE